MRDMSTLNVAVSIPTRILLHSVTLIRSNIHAAYENPVIKWSGNHEGQVEVRSHKLW